MNQFERIATGADQREMPAKTMVAVKRRKDGKFSARYCFYAKSITKIVTRAQLKEDNDSGRFCLIGIASEELY